MEKRVEGSGKVNLVEVMNAGESKRPDGRAIVALYPGRRPASSSTLRLGCLLSSARAAVDAGAGPVDASPRPSAGCDEWQVELFGDASRPRWVRRIVDEVLDAVVPHVEEIVEKPVIGGIRDRRGARIARIAALVPHGREDAFRATLRAAAAWLAREGVSIGVTRLTTPPGVTASLALAA